MKRITIIALSILIGLCAFAQTASAKRAPNVAKMAQQATIITKAACHSRSEYIEIGVPYVKCFGIEKPACGIAPKTKLGGCVMSFWLHNLSPAAHYKWQYCLGSAQWISSRLATVIVPSSLGFTCNAVEYGPPGTAPFPPIQDLRTS